MAELDINGERRRARTASPSASASQEFCIDIMSVREIRGWTPATALPQRAGLRARRDQSARRRCCRSSISPSGSASRRPTPTPRHVIIVAQIGAQVVGLLVDAVSDISPCRPTRCSRRRTSARKLRATFVLGVMAIDDRMISLIALEHVMPTLSRRGRMTQPDAPLAARRRRRSDRFRRVRAEPRRFPPHRGDDLRRRRHLLAREQGDAGLCAARQAPARARAAGVSRLLRSRRRTRRAATSARKC